MKSNVWKTCLAWAIPAALFLTACNSGSDSAPGGADSTLTAGNGDTSALKPTGAKPAWAPSMKPEMQVVIEKLASYNAPAIDSLSAQQARKNPTPTTAVMDVMKEKNIPMPAPQVDTSGRDIPGGHARIYTPRTQDTALPVIVYYHGGGWVIADLDTYDASAKALAEQTGAIVVSVHYRQAPEHKFPAAHNDAFAAYQWVVKNAASMNGDPKRIAVAGESAGGNLAANVAIMARDKKMPMPVHQLLIYPIAGNDMNSPSYVAYAEAKPLNKPMMQWFMKNYLSDTSKAADPRIALVKANLKGLPPATIITAEIDPLQNDGMMLRDRLKDAGVDVQFRNYDGVTHEFFGMAAVVPQAKEAQAFAATNLREVFGKR